MRPSACSLRANSATSIRSLPSPASDKRLTSKFIVPRAAYRLKKPETSTSCPTSRSSQLARYKSFHIRHLRAEERSLIVKYTALYPRLADTSDTSPTTVRRMPLSVPLTMSSACETVRALRSCPSDEASTEPCA